MQILIQIRIQIQTRTQILVQTAAKQHKTMINNQQISH